MSEFKTNVMRILEKAKIDYAAHEYPHGKDAVDGISVAKLLGQNPECVFKTLVTKGVSGGYFVFVVPVAEEFDSCKRYFKSNRLHSRRLLTYRNEKAIPYRFPRKLP